MARFAFVSRTGQDILQIVSIPCECTDSHFVAYCNEPETFGYRLVFVFFEGQFMLEEIYCFMQDVALSSGTALAAT